MARSQAALGRDGEARKILVTSDVTGKGKGLKLTDVGIDRDTLSKFHSRLVRINNQRTVPKTIPQLWVKYLSQISFPKILADEALKQLQNPTYLIVGGPNAGQPDLIALVQSFEELWHNIYDKGIEIKPQAAPRPMPDRSNRVDGLSNTLTPIREYGSEDSGGDVWTADADLHESFQVCPPVSYQAGQIDPSFAFLKNERNCWTCKGWGHTKEKCPSAATVKRPLAACIQGLEALRAAEGARFNSFRRNARITRRSGPSPGRRPVAREATLLDTEESLIQYDDGGIYTIDGAEIVPPPDMPAPTDVSDTTPQASTATPQPQPSTETPVEGEKTIVDAKSNTAYKNIDSAIAKDFSSTMGFNAELQSPESTPDDFEYFAPREKRSVALGFAVAALTTLGAAALATRSVKGRALMLSMLALAGRAGGAHIESQTRVHASVFSRSQRATAFDLHIGPNHTDPLLKCRQHGVMDTGTTECTSGRRKLFPDDGIEEWRPNLKVEVASGRCLDVAFRGVMAFKVRPLNVTSTKKFITISVPHSLYVPNMPVTLISTKALFAYNKIRTYFNDELTMLLPDGTNVQFVETHTNYTLLFVDDDECVQPVRIAKPKAVARGSRSKAQAAYKGRLTLRNPTSLTWDLCHERFCHFSPERIAASQQFVTGIDIKSLGTPSRHTEPCIACVRGGFRGHRHGKRPPDQFVRFAQRIYSDSCAMPKSTPFGYTEMYIFYDACTKYIAVYFGKTTQAWEMLIAFQTFIADHKQWMPKGHVEEWYMDGGPEFKTSDTEKFCAEMHTRRRFIVPWNPWMNVAETGWRIILRPLRIVLAASNVSKALWPFAVSQIVLVHNALSSSSETSHVSDESSLAMAFMNSIMQRPPPPSPYFNVTGKPFDLSRLRCIFCEVEVRIRNKDDLRKMDKLDSVTATAVYLGISTKHSNQALVYFVDKARFTVASYNDCYFREHVRPRVARIVGTLDMPGYEAPLPTEAQQMADAGDVDPPDLTLPILPAVPGNGGVDNGGATNGGATNGGATNGGARTDRHGDAFTWRENHCSHVIVAVRRNRQSGLGQGVA